VAGAAAAVAAIVKVFVGKHIVASGPALVVDIFPLNTVMVIWSLTDGSHEPLDSVHWKTLFPRLNPLTVADVGPVGAMVPVPETKVHWPVPGAVGAFPLMLAVMGVLVKQNV
jgi:hypothetical protein